MKKLKILVVDDSAVYRKILTAAVEATGMAYVEHTASNGYIALERIGCNNYDAVLLDVNMPEMDGMETLLQIKAKWPALPVIMISGVGGKNASTTIHALQSGAMDFILKPLEQDYEKNMEIVRNHLKVLFSQLKIRENTGAVQRLKDDVFINPIKTKLTGVDLVVVASSTGGPGALEKIFEGFGQDFHKPVLIVQHMPPDFTKVLADSLDKKSFLHFTEGNEGDVVRAGQAVIAPGGLHMMVRKGERSLKEITLSNSSYVNGVRPAADVTFKSIADTYAGARVLAVVLTGMGNDGTQGVRELKQKCTCYCITQTEKTCVVYGMPRCVKEAGLSDEEADLDSLAGRIRDIAEYGS